MKLRLLCLANKLYEHCYPAYFPLYLAYKAISDQTERRLFRQFIQPGMTVVDVGANIGVYTRYFAGLIGEQGRVHSFEPDPSNFGHMQVNTRGLNQVVLNHAAVGDHKGSIRLFVSDELNVDHQTYDNGEGRRSIEVPLLSLDDYFALGQRVDFIKLDVQGYEWNVLQGAKRILAENPDIKLIMEFWPWGLKKAGTDPGTVIAFLRSLGFRLHIVTKAGYQLVEGSLPLDTANFNEYCNILAQK